MTKFYISGGSDDFWTKTNAKTLNSAKAIASKTYQQSIGGKIEVAEVEYHSEFRLRYVPVAVKYGYDNWQQA